MKGLILKDLYMMKKYCRSMLLITVIFLSAAVVNPGSPFFLLYPAVFAGTALFCKADCFFKISAYYPADSRSAYHLQYTCHRAFSSRHRNKYGVFHTFICNIHSFGCRSVTDTPLYIQIWSRKGQDCFLYSNHTALRAVCRYVCHRRCCA